MRRLVTTVSATCLAAGLAFGGGAAQAQQTAKWSESGAWQIMVDRTLQNSCFMIGSYSVSKTVLRVGFNNTDNSSYLIIGNPAWNSLEAGKMYEITAGFDGETPTTWHATALRMEDTMFLRVNFFQQSPTEVFTRFGQSLGLRVWYHGTEVAGLKLTDAAAATAETINCNNQFVASPGSSDPFKPQPRPATTRDPFA